MWFSRISTVVLAALCLVVGGVAPSACASGRLVVGMPISIGRGECSLGFFAFNARNDHFAVTAGHCSSRPGQIVYWDDVPIGDVVLRRGDAEDENGNLVGARGYTLIRLLPDYGVEPYFSGIGVAEKGDFVTKFGQRSGRTSGHVTAVRAVKGRPDLGMISSDLVQLPGDSGGPWVTGTTLVGIGSSGNMERGGGGAGSQGQPVWSIIDMVRDDDAVWGDGFKVWVGK